MLEGSITTLVAYKPSHKLRYLVLFRPGTQLMQNNTRVGILESG